MKNEEMKHHANPSENLLDIKLSANHNKRFVEIDLLRGLAIILMIMGHSFIIHPINILEVPWCSSVSHWIYTFHMELFFFISGCVYKCRDYKTYITKKFNRIFLPYMFWGVLLLLFHSFGTSLVNRHKGIDDGLFDLVFKGGNLWFLYTLFILFAIYPYIEKVFNSFKKEILFVVLLIVLSWFLPKGILFALKKLVYYLPYFILGKYFMNARLKMRLGKSLCVAILFFCIAIFAGLDYIENILGIDIPPILHIRALAMIAITYFIAILLEKLGKKIEALGSVNNLLVLCSKYSLQLYIFNGFWIVLIRTVIVSILHIKNPFVIVVCMVAGNVIITLLVCIFFLPKIPLMARLTGIENSNKQ